MRDHVIRETVNKLRDIAIEYHATQQLRERIAHVIVPLLAGEEPASLLEREGWPLPDSTEVTRTAPKRIWLQVSDDYGDHNEPFPTGAELGFSEVTWCADSQGGTQVEYVRADMVAFPELTPVYARHSFMPLAPATPEGWKIEPLDDGCVAIRKDGVGGYVASLNPENIASTILHAFASDMLAATKPQGDR